VKSEVIGRYQVEVRALFSDERAGSFRSDKEPSLNCKCRQGSGNGQISRIPGWSRSTSRQNRDAPRINEQTATSRERGSD